MKNRENLSGIARMVSILALGMGVVWSTSLAGAQTDHVAALNEAFKLVPENRRSDLVLLPAMVDLEEPPLGVDTPEAAALQYDGSSIWGAAEAWATGPSQQAALEALRKVTDGSERGRAMSFAQPYGPALSIDPELIRAGLYTALGDPPLLAGARFLYLERMRDLVCLAHVEATRLAAEGQVGQACDLMVDLTYLGRQLTDRAFDKEVKFGYDTMIGAVSRIRDIAYVDFRGARLLGTSDIERVIKALEMYNRGYLDPARLRFPEGNRIAAQQLFEQVYEPRGGVREDQYAKTMARLRTSGRPLRLFAEASRYESAGANQADWFETRDKIDEVFTSWSSRWTLKPFDRQLSLPYTWDLMDRERFGVITASTSDLSELYLWRQVFETETVGTRHALAVLGYYYELGVWPPEASSVRPRWLERMEADPFNPAREAGRLPPMKFFVPVRDDYVADERDTPQPHEMNVFPRDGSNFALLLDEREFVMYSVGRNGVDDFAEDVSDEWDMQTGDYLIWPPMLSLHRRHLQQTNQLP